MFPERLKTKVAATVIAVTLCSAGAAAAAGNLPDRIQAHVSRAALHVSLKISQPSEASDAIKSDGDDDDADEPDDTTTTSTSTSSTTSTTSTSTTQPQTSTTEADESGQQKTPVGPDVNGPAKKGLCNAYLGSLAKGHPKNPDAVAFKNLIDAAALAGQTVQEFCAADASTSTTMASGSSSSESPTTTERDNGNGKGHGKP
jgi:hypothetical protein